MLYLIIVIAMAVVHIAIAAILSKAPNPYQKLATLHSTASTVWAIVGLVLSYFCLSAIVNRENLASVTPHIFTFIAIIAMWIAVGAAGIEKVFARRSSPGDRSV